MCIVVHRRLSAMYMLHRLNLVMHCDVYISYRPHVSVCVHVFSTGCGTGWFTRCTVMAPLALRKHVFHSDASCPEEQRSAATSILLTHTSHIHAKFQLLVWLDHRVQLGIAYIPMWHPLQSSSLYYDKSVCLWRRRRSRRASNKCVCFDALPNEAMKWNVYMCLCKPAHANAAKRTSKLFEMIETRDAGYVREIHAFWIWKIC